MNVDVKQIESVVRKAITRTLKENTFSSLGLGIFSDMDDAIEAASKAQGSLISMNFSKRSKLIDAMRAEMLKEENISLISQMAVDETRMGRYDHKLIKNRLAIEKTPGVEDLRAECWSGDGGLTLLEFSPFGVIGAITPTTNPSETIICNSIGMIASGNSVVFSPHPRAKNTSLKTVEILNKAIIEAGGPRNLVTTITRPSLEAVEAMMKHPKIEMLVATGGPGVVKAVLSSGKKAIGAGAGNPPAVVDETADIEKAAVDIINGCSFDNNLPCIAEKEVIVVESVADYLIFNMKQHGAYEIKDEDTIKELMKVVLNDNGNPSGEFMGKSPAYILDKIGIKVDENILVIIVEVDKDHPFVVKELMMPILPIVRVENFDKAVEVAVEVEHGNRHTAIMHSKNVDNLSRLAKEIQTTIFVKNGPSYAGIGVGGEGYSTFTIAGPTGEGLTSAKSFTRKRRCTLMGGLFIK
ncbi:MAG: aldehyde dehydrogenase EutE [Clostridia bacterium]|nr:aldehyde dehydrogenase EutE [Clostridia bacterium]